MNAFRTVASWTTLARGVIAGTLAGLAVHAAAQPFTAPSGPPPEWAYVVNPPDFKPVPDDGTQRRVPGSKATFTLTQLRDRFMSHDWHPEDHPPMPPVVAQGRKPGTFACAFCHRVNGTGGPENASLAGLPFAYIVRQMQDYRSGARKTSVPKRAPTELMMSLSKGITDAEIESAAAYFAALKPRRSIKVVETTHVPKTFVAGWFLADATPREAEPIGQRIIEVPEDLDQFESRDSRSNFIAYVPPGSLRKGEQLAATGGNGRTLQCAACHGTDLRGVAAIPPIVGRSPSYIVRQLYDLQSGARAGADSAQMKDVVAKLTLEDMVSLAAWLASREP